jgi:hypothetical protein
MSLKRRFYSVFQELNVMNFVLFLLFGAGVFALSLIGHKKYHNTTLYALAIGGVVNANYFHAANYPIECFGLPFGIDSIIYTLFAFCVIVMLLRQTKKDAYLLAVSSIIAILFSAFMELAAKMLAGENLVEAGMVFELFLISAVASAIAVIAAIETVQRMKEKYNQYVCMALGIGIITIVNSTIYYSATAILRGATDNIWLYFSTAFAGKGIALIYSLVALKVLNLLQKKKA